MAVLHVILSLVLLEIISYTTSLPEETFVQMPSSLEDEDSYFYMDTRSESDPKQSETRRRSTLDKNFARFGRGDLAPMAAGPCDFGGAPADDGGNSDFIRFGRDPYRVAARGGQQHFVRFGRSVAAARAKPRNKREAVEKRPSGSNFVRFGRNDNFMRFGRQPEQMGAVPDDGAKQQRQSNYKEEYLMRLLMEYLTRPHQPSRLA